MKLHVKGVTNMSLFYHTCIICGELNVHGFWQQLDKKIDYVKRVAVVSLPCHVCGVVKVNRYRLTTASRTRLLPWADWFRTLLSFLDWLPYRWRLWLVGSLIGRVLWLETRYPL